MDDWIVFLFSLLLLMAGGAFFFVYFKLKKMESRLRKDLASKQVESNLRTILEGVEQLDLRPVEGYLLELREILKRIERKLARDLAPDPKSPPAAPEGSLREIIESRLTHLGFNKINILTDLDSLNADPCEIQVEASKDDVCYKGRLRVHGGVVVESRMQPSYELFP